MYTHILCVIVLCYYDCLLSLFAECVYLLSCFIIVVVRPSIADAASGACCTHSS